MYWSEAVAFIKILVATVEATSEPVDFAYFTIELAIRSNKPADSITPLNTIAVKINQIVFSIPAIPLVVSNSFTSSFEEIILTDPNMVFINAI